MDTTQSAPPKMSNSAGHNGHLRISLHKPQERRLSGKEQSASNLVSAVITPETKAILMLLMRKEPQTASHLAETFMEVTGHLWKTARPDRMLRSMMEISMIPFGFVEKYKDHCIAEFSLGPKEWMARPLLCLPSRSRRPATPLCTAYLPGPTHPARARAHM